MLLAKEEIDMSKDRWETVVVLIIITIALATPILIEMAGEWGWL